MYTDDTTVHSAIVTGVTDPDDLERLVLSHAPRFRSRPSFLARNDAEYDYCILGDC